MTKIQQDKLDKGTHTLVPKWEMLVRYGSLLAIASAIYTFGTNDSNAEHRMFDTPLQKSNLLHHVKDKSGIHMSLKNKQDEFITRREYDITLKSINTSLKAINEKINK